MTHVTYDLSFSCQSRVFDGNSTRFDASIGSRQRFIFISRHQHDHRVLI